MPRRSSKPSKALAPVRIDQVVNVFILMQTETRMTLKQACSKVGISEREFRYWLPRAQEAINVVRESSLAVRKIELAEILLARNQILQKVIQDGLAFTTLPIDRLTILQHLEQRAEKLEAEIAPVSSDGVDEILGMPVLKPGESRFAGRFELLEEENSLTIRVHPPEVIEGELRELPTSRTDEHSPPSYLSPA